MIFSSGDGFLGREMPGHTPAAELARRQGVTPAESVKDLARDDIFESDEELDEFLAELYAWRHAGLDAATWSPSPDTAEIQPADGPADELAVDEDSPATQARRDGTSLTAEVTGSTLAL